MANISDKPNYVAKSNLWLKFNQNSANPIFKDTL